MASINGSYRRTDDRPIVYFEAEQTGERWSCLAKVGGERFEASTWQPSPWATIERLIGEALDSAARDAEPQKFDMNKRLAKPAAPPPRRRGRLPPNSVPRWEPPDNAA
jgi:hypothetical protein